MDEMTIMKIKLNQTLKRWDRKQIKSVSLSLLGMIAGITMSDRSEANAFRLPNHFPPVQVRQEAQECRFKPIVAKPVLSPVG